MKRASDEIWIAPPSEAEVGYLAGIMDGEGYFHAGRKSKTFGLRVAMIDEPVIEWLRLTFQGSTSRGGLTSVGNRVFVWTLQRQADLGFILPLILPHLRCKRAQAEAMLVLLEHLRDHPSKRWTTATSMYSNVGRGGEERERRRQAWTEWREKAEQLRIAVRDAR